MSRGKSETWVPKLQPECSLQTKKIRWKTTKVKEQMGVEFFTGWSRFIRMCLSEVPENWKLMESRFLSLFVLIFPLGSKFAWFERISLRIVLFVWINRDPPVVLHLSLRVLTSLPARTNGIHRFASARKKFANCSRNRPQDWNHSF